MIWEITDTHRVRVEPLNFVLERRHHTKPTGDHPEGREVWKVVGYHSGLESALRAIPDDIAALPEVQDYAGLRARLEALVGQLARRVGR